MTSYSVVGLHNHRFISLVFSMYIVGLKEVSATSGDDDTATLTGRFDF